LQKKVFSKRLLRENCQNLTNFNPHKGNYIIDRNLATGLKLVSDCFGQIPEQQPDGFGDCSSGHQAMYTVEAARRMQHPLIGSAHSASQQLLDEGGRREEHVEMVPVVHKSSRGAALLPTGQGQQGDTASLFSALGRHRSRLGLVKRMSTRIFAGILPNRFIFWILFKYYFINFIFC
jgi:hypothetical protein